MSIAIILTALVFGLFIIEDKIQEGQYIRRESYEVLKTYLVEFLNPLSAFRIQPIPEQGAITEKLGRDWDKSEGKLSVYYYRIPKEVGQDELSQLLLNLNEMSKILRESQDELTEGAYNILSGIIENNMGVVKSWQIAKQLNPKLTYDEVKKHFNTAEQLGNPEAVRNRVIIDGFTKYKDWEEGVRNGALF